MSRRPRRWLAWVAEHVVLVVLAVLFVAPIVIVLLTSFMTSGQTLTSSIWPDPWDPGNYVRAITRVPLLLWLGNSLLYAVLATAFMLVSSVPAAYVLAKIPLPFARAMFVAIIVTMLLPPQVTVVPLYIWWAQLGLTGTLWPLILPNLLGNAFSIFLMRQFFVTVPSEYVDAARIDGAGEWAVLVRVMAPMAKSGIAAAAIFQFLYSWNDYFGPLLYASSQDSSWPLAYGLATFHGSHGTDWGLTMAVTMLVTAPVVVLFFFAQRTFVEGINLTGIK